MAQEKFTWSDLQKAISEMNAEELARQISIAIDDESQFKNVSGVEEIPEDIYVNKGDPEDCGDLTTLKEAHGSDFNEEDYVLSTPKGRKFLWAEY